MDVNVEATRREIQSQFEEVVARADKRRGTGACKNESQPPKFDGTTLWAVFRRQFETVADNICWTRQETSAYS
jgi:hypothetical protein